MQGKAEHIIWQNEDQTVTIVDIPRSIEDAQQAGGSQLPFKPIPAVPLARPYVMPEPKSESARLKLSNQHPEPTGHAAYAKVHEEVSQKVSTAGCTVWHLERSSSLTSPLKEIVQPQDVAQKRSRPTTQDDSYIELYADHLTHELLPDAGIQPSPSSDTNADTAALDLSRWPVISNNADRHILMSCTNTSESTYILPPGVSVLCGDIQSTSVALRHALREQHGHSARFNLVLLDPPWKNASVKRSRHYATMPPSPTLDLLIATDLEVIMADQCLVCIWITNKAGARQAVTSEDGIFAQWGVQLIEEWVWFKVTSSGELIFPMSTITRKPYEVLLVGRKHRSYPVQPTADPVVRRALFAVPDLHSRKPCLKALLEPMLSKQVEYLALEVFARNLVAGWWSWGNECLLFNERSHWNASS